LKKSGKRVIARPSRGGAGNDAACGDNPHHSKNLTRRHKVLVKKKGIISHFIRIQRAFKPICL
jgi:hypothetical protein